MSTTHIEIETVDQLRAAAPNLAGQVVQGVDLTGCSNLLRHCDVSTTIFLGCSTSARLAAWLRARGALIFPAIPGVPFDPYHPGAYTAEELYNDIGEGYHVTLDAAIDRWRRGLATPPRLRDTLATALHDDAMTDALDDLLAGTDPSMTVGVMGGHSVTRDSDDYRLAADLGAALAGTGHLVTTWGGPGAMEATNLGAACPPDLLDESLDRLRKVAGTADVTTWVQAGLDVVSSWPQGAAHRTIAASRRGSTVTNHPMSLRPASSSTSRMRCAKISSSTVAEAGSFTYLAKRAPSRKSSKLSLVTTTPPAKTR